MGKGAIMAGPWEKFSAPEAKAKVEPKANESKKPWEQFSEEPYYNPVEKTGIKAIETILSVPGVAPALKGYEKYVASPIRRTVQEGPKEAVKKYGEPAPSLRETAGKIGVSTKSLSEILPTLFSEKPSEYQKPLTWKKGGWADVSLADVLGTAGDIAVDPSTYIGVGAAAKGVGKLAKGVSKGALKGAAAGGELAAKAVPSTVKAVGAGLKEGTEEALGAITRGFRTTVDPYAKKAVQVAQKFDLDPKLVLNPNIEFGQASTAAKNYRMLMQSPGGDEMIQKFMTGKQAISEAVDSQVSKIAKGAQFPKTPEQAGNLLRQSYETAVDNFFKQRDITFDSVQKMLPELNQVGLTPNQLKAVQSKLTGIRRKAAGLMNMGGTQELKSQGKILMDFANGMQNTIGRKSYKQLVRDLRSIGDVAYKTPNLAPNVAKAYKEFYTTLSGSLVDTVDDLGRRPGGQIVETLGKSLKENNAAFTDFFNKQQYIDTILSNERLGGEKIFNAFLRGDTKLLDDVLTIAGDETTKKQLAGFLIDNAIRDKDGIIQFGATRNLFKNNERLKSVLSRLIGPEEINALDEILELGEKYGSDILNPSRTAEFGLYQNLKESLLNRPIQKGYQKYLEATARGAKEISPLGLQATEPSLQALIAGGGQVPQPAMSLQDLIKRAGAKTPVSVPRQLLGTQERAK